MRATSLLTVQQREACVDLFEAGYWGYPQIVDT